MVDGARSNGMSDIAFARNSDEAADIVANTTKSGDVILVKGSRGVRTEKVIEKLLEKFPLEEEEAATV